MFEVISIKGDDVVMIEVGGVRIVMMIDYLCVFVNDFYLMICIVVNYVLGDVWVMGGKFKYVMMLLILFWLNCEIY